MKTLTKYMVREYETDKSYTETEMTQHEVFVKMSESFTNEKNLNGLKRVLEVCRFVKYVKVNRNVVDVRLVDNDLYI